MKHLALILFLLLFSGIHSFGQDTTSTKGPKMVVVKNDGARYVGYILSDDAREILMETEQVGLIYIPKHLIKSIAPFKKEDVVTEEVAKDTSNKAPPIEEPTDSDLVDELSQEEEPDIESDSTELENHLASKYIQLDNAIPLRKGDAFVKIMPLGVEAQFPVTKNWSIGGWSTYWGFPMGFRTKYSFPMQENMHFSADLIAGTMAFGSLADFSIRDGGISPSFTFTLGDRKSNFSVKLGYIYAHEYFEGDSWTDMNGEVITWPSESWNYHMGYTSFGGMFEINPNTTFVAEALFVIGEFGVTAGGGAAVRFGNSPRNLWQLGGSLWISDGGFLPIPLPHVSYTYVFGKRNT